MPNGVPPPDSEPKIPARPLVDKEGNPVQGNERRLQTVRNVITFLKVKGAADRREDGQLGELGRSLEDAARRLETLLNAGGVYLVDDLPRDNPARTSTNPANPDEKRVEIRTEMVDRASNQCDPLFLHLTNVVFHEGVHLGQANPRRPDPPANWDTMTPEEKAAWRRQHLIPYKMQYAAGEFVAYRRDLDYISQMTAVIQKIKQNKADSVPDVLDGLTDAQKTWGRLWRPCTDKGLDAALKLIQDKTASKQTALQVLGTLAPNGQPRPESEYGQVEQALGAEQGALERTLDTGYHFTWFFERAGERLLWISFRGDSAHSTDGVHLGMESPQCVRYVAPAKARPFLVICGTTLPNGRGEPRVLVRPAQRSTLSKSTGSWEPASIGDFAAEEQAEVSIPPDLLARPTSVLLTPAGKLYVWDAQAMGLYALVDADGDGLPDTLRVESSVRIPPSLASTVQDAVSLEWYGEQPAARTRPVIGARGTAPVVFFMDPDRDGVFEVVRMIQPGREPWLRPLVTGILEAGAKQLTASGAGGHHFKLGVTGPPGIVIEGRFSPDGESTVVALPRPLAYGERVGLVDLDNGLEAVSAPVTSTRRVERTSGNSALPLVLLSELLPEGAELPTEVKDPVEYLDARFGPGRRQRTDEGDRIQYLLPDRLIQALVKPDGMVGWMRVFPQVLPLTCTPISIPPVFMLTGTGSETVSIVNPLGVPGALAQAIAKASADYALAWARFKLKNCGGRCVPPCVCTATHSMVPLPLITETVNRVLGVPVSITFTATWSGTGILKCL